MKAVLIKLALVASALAAPASAGECVVLLHGLARGAGSMEPLAEALEDAGYFTVNLGYPSREKPIEVLAESTVPEGLQRCEGRSPVHFVTHSMGGILVRQFLETHRLPELGRVVMLGPPNQGSEVVDTLGDVPGFTWLNGTAGLQLGTEADGLVHGLGPADFDLGIIAGNRSVNLILSGIIPGEDDGKVSVERARLDGMHDFMVLPVTHTFMMRDDEVIRQVIHFLGYGRFYRSPSPVVSDDLSGNDGQ